MSRMSDEDSFENGQNSDEGEEGGKIQFASKFNRRSGVRRFSLPITPARRESRRSSIVSIASSTCKNRPGTGRALTALTAHLTSDPPWSPADRTVPSRPG
ncbi:hypothetical protein FJT64_008477 [Amphibalanus amphitrite]|uniref:Uncharacterized protein n=1 Tax=Amphibalanus amphitrite TaxID=1232801 RepID=A0A6A4VJI5_AMPAM|nr:hypothetical protein FJT64_008477 [Amphibalanus amphitrite]